MKSIKLLIVLLSLMIVLVGPASASSDKTIFYNITTDEAWRAGMAVGQANAAMGAGYKVVIFLNVRGVLLASKSFTSDSFGNSGKSVQDMLKMAMDNGATVVICPMCMDKVGMTMDDLLPGIIKGGPDVTLKAMTADNTVVISY